MAEDVVIAGEEGSAVQVFLDIGPDGTADRVGTSAVPGNIGQGAEQRVAIGTVQQLVQVLGAVGIDNIIVAPHPALGNPGMGEKDRFSGDCVDMDQVEQVQVFPEQTIELHRPEGISPAGVDVRVQIPQVVIAQQEDNPVGVFLFKVDDFFQHRQGFLGEDPFLAVRVHIIPEEDKLGLAVKLLDGLSPK